MTTPLITAEVDRLTDARRDAGFCHGLASPGLFWAQAMPGSNATRLTHAKYRITTPIHGVGIDFTKGFRGGLAAMQFSERTA